MTIAFFYCEMERGLCRHRMELNGSDWRKVDHVYLRTVIGRRKRSWYLKVGMKCEWRRRSGALCLFLLLPPFAVWPNVMYISGERGGTWASEGWTNDPFFCSVVELLTLDLERMKKRKGRWAIENISRHMIRISFLGRLEPGRVRSTYQRDEWTSKAMYCTRFGSTPTRKHKEATRLFSVVQQLLSQTKQMEEKCGILFGPVGWKTTTKKKSRLDFLNVHMPWFSTLVTNYIIAFFQVHAHTGTQGSYPVLWSHDERRKLRDVKVGWNWRERRVKKKG